MLERDEEFWLGLMLINMERRRKKKKEKKIHVKSILFMRTRITNKWTYVEKGWLIKHSQCSVRK